MKKKKIILCFIGAVVLVGIGITTGMYVDHQHKIEAKEALVQKNKQIERSVLKEYKGLFTDDQQKSIKLEVTSQEVIHFQKQVKTLANQKLKKEYQNRIMSMERFIAVRDKARSYLPSEILVSSTSDEVIQTLQNEFVALEEGFQPVIKNMLDMIQAQRTVIKELESLMNKFFDGETLKEGINHTDLNRAKEIISTLPQKDLVEKYKGKLDQIQEHLDALEAQERARLEAQRQAAIQAQILESQRIAAENAKAAASNIIIANIPMINQKLGVLNGCEGASLLMALQHFGFNTGMTLAQIATEMPKSDDPHKGFIHDIFSAEPYNVPHWIAPDALAAFGQTYYSGVQNFTGASPEQLRAEIDQGNPVIIYATYGFYPEEYRVGEVPRNLHVMLLMGYNSYTGSYIVADPWGGIQLNVAKSKFENAYNRMRFAVAVRNGGAAPQPTETREPQQLTTLASIMKMRYLFDGI